MVGRLGRGRVLEKRPLAPPIVRSARRRMLEGATPYRPQEGLRPLVLIALLGLVGLAGGCVERRMTIRSEPSNALVILDGQELGHTPVSTSFTYYGDRQIKIIKDGYETKTIHQKVSTPWYEIPPIDFISEVLVPWRIRDHREYVYSLEPSTMVIGDELISRAEQVRAEGQNPPPESLRRAGIPQTANKPTDGGPR